MRRLNPAQPQPFTTSTQGQTLDERLLTDIHIHAHTPATFLPQGQHTGLGVVGSFDDGLGQRFQSAGQEIIRTLCPQPSII